MSIYALPIIDMPLVKLQPLLFNLRRMEWERHRATDGLLGIPAACGSLGQVSDLILPIVMEQLGEAGARPLPIPSVEMCHRLLIFSSVGVSAIARKDVQRLEYAVYAGKQAQRVVQEQIVAKVVGEAAGQVVLKNLQLLIQYLQQYKRSFDT